jgi:hypothetical protein
MNPKICSLIAAGLLASLSGAALADDSPTDQPVKTPKQRMQDCMAQQRASNSGLSKQDMHKACAAKLQSEDNHPSRPPPSDPSRT